MALRHLPPACVVAFAWHDVRWVAALNGPLPTARRAPDFGVGASTKSRGRRARRLRIASCVTAGEFALTEPGAALAPLNLQAA